jgi:hypothetical protein
MRGLTVSFVPSASRRSQAGAVSATWVIVLVVAWLATLGLWFASASELTQRVDERVAAEAERDEAEARLEAQLVRLEELSALVGYRDTATAGLGTDSAAMQAEIDGVKQQLGSVLGSAETKVTLQQAVGALRSALQTSQAALVTAQTDLEAEVAKRRTAETNVNTATEGLSTQLDQLNQQLADERQRADNQSQADARRFDELVAAQQASDSAARDAQQALAEFEVRARRDTSTLEAQIKSLAVRREGAEPEALDGSILSVGKSGAVAYIDVGAHQGLRRGTRFEVLRRGKSGDLSPMGTVEVRDVEDDMALVGLTAEPDAFDPILPGDSLRNPHFEANKTLHFFLLGDFPLTMSKEQATARLRELGAEVDETMDTGTDVLVLGDKSLAEGEFAQELTDTDEYKLADKLGMRIIRLAELADFLKY